VSGCVRSRPREDKETTTIDTASGRRGFTTSDGDDEPRPYVRLVGEDGNAFAILGRVQGALRKAGWSKERRDAFFTEAKSGNYDHLLATVMKYLDVD
jgi:hypothetical protein